MRRGGELANEIKAAFQGKFINTYSNNNEKSNSSYIMEEESENNDS